MQLFKMVGKSWEKSNMTTKIHHMFPATKMPEKRRLLPSLYTTEYTTSGSKDIAISIQIIQCYHGYGNIELATLFPTWLP